MTSIFPQIVSNISSPYGGFGLLEGPNVISPYASMYGGQLNAFEILQCPFNPASLASCSSAARIDSSGNVHAAGAFFANGSDYGESVMVRGDLREHEPGDVLAVDPEGRKQFLKSDRAYSPAVAGIYSTKPGLLGSSHALDNSAFRSEIPLAINGIVPCKVSTQNGSIKPGDLLVSASRPGYAMKGTDKARMVGAIVGKALGNLQSGVGVVPVLVMLQ
jgi:hypothetical protein